MTPFGQGGVIQLIALSPLQLPNSHPLACPHKTQGKSEISRETKDSSVSGLPRSLGVHSLEPIRSCREQQRKGRREEKALGWHWASACSGSPSTEALDMLKNLK